MLNQPPIFLGGQGGIIGPLRMGYGNVVAAGTILRRDYIADNQLIFESAPTSSVRDYLPAAYPALGRVVENNIIYLANLAALEAWYIYVRRPFLEAQQFGSLLYEGVMKQLSAARKERLKRLKAMAEKAKASTAKELNESSVRGRKELHDQMEYIAGFFKTGGADRLEMANKLRDEFLKDFEKAAGNSRTNYIETIQGLPAETSLKGSLWLNNIVDALGEKVMQAAPSLNLFKK